MENNNVELLPWPAYSPDMNIIENVWAHYKDQVEKKKHIIKNQDDL
jgi:transposase